MTQLVTAGRYADGEAARLHFDRWTSVYSRSRLLASLQEKALSELDPRPEDHVLDVACGAGRLVRAVAPQVERAVGIDLSPAMIDKARTETRDQAPAAGPIEFLVGPSDRLPFGDGEFTAVVTTTSFHHFPDPAASVGEMVRVLRPGGRLVIGDSVRDTLPARFGDAVLRRFERGHVGLQSSEGFARLYDEAGLQLIRLRPVWSGLYAFVVGTKASS